VIERDHVAFKGVHQRYVFRWNYYGSFGVVEAPGEIRKEGGKRIKPHTRNCKEHRMNNYVINFVQLWKELEHGDLAPARFF
jgi:hypothetical protein